MTMPTPHLTVASSPALTGDPSRKWNVLVDGEALFLFEDSEAATAFRDWLSDVALPEMESAEYLADDAATEAESAHQRAVSTFTTSGAW